MKRLYKYKFKNLIEIDVNISFYKFLLNGGILKWVLRFDKLDFLKKRILSIRLHVQFLIKFEKKKIYKMIKKS